MKRVLFCGKETGLDPESFCSLGAGYASDGEEVAYMGETIAEADSKSFSVVSGFDGAFARDSNRLYFRGEPLDCDPGAIPLSRIVLQVAKGRQVFCLDPLQPNSVALSHVIEGTPRLVEDAFLVTENDVFIGKHRLKADAKSFRLLGQRPAQSSWGRFFTLQHAYAADTNSVWGLEQFFPPKKLAISSEGFEATGLWSKNRDRVFYDGRHIRDVDPESIEFLSDGWARTKAAIWFQGQKLCGADPSSIAFLQGSFARDSRQLWMGSEALEELEATAELCALGPFRVQSEVEHIYCEAIFKDSQAVWAILHHDSDYSCGTSMDVLEGADVATYKILDASIGLARDKNYLWLGVKQIGDASKEVRTWKSGYWVVGTKWWYGEGGKLPQVRAQHKQEAHSRYACFDVLDPGPIMNHGDGFLGNALTIWHRGYELEVAATDAKSLGSGFLRSAKTISHWEVIMTSRKIGEYDSLGGPLENADLESFEVVGDNYARDKNQVFYGTSTTALSPSALQLLGGGWARDDTRVCCMGQLIEVEPDKLRVLGGTQTNQYAGGQHGAYACDGVTLYHGATKLADEYGMREVALDAGSFRIISELFARDKQHLLCLVSPSVVENVDLDSFRVLEGPWARDDNQVIYATSWTYALKDVELESFEVMNACYARDARTVWAHGEPTKIDAATMHVVDGAWCCDATAVWCNGRKVEEADPASFAMSTISPGLFRDHANLYGGEWGGWMILALDEEPLAPIGDGYWRAGSQLYFRENPIAEAQGDPELTGRGVLTLDGQTYFEGVLLETY